MADSYDQTLAMMGIGGDKASAMQAFGRERALHRDFPGAPQSAPASIGAQADPPAPAPTLAGPISKSPGCPAPVAAGRNGRWVNLGEVGVDSGTMAITDPIFADQSASHGRHALAPTGCASVDFGSGVMFCSGLGDGGYIVWAWVADYGNGAKVDERIGQIVVTLIDNHDIAEWHHTPCPDCSACTGCRGKGCDQCGWTGELDNYQPCR
ncbi:hypothetical protein [Mycobacteroides abscessus]|uniref:hypothetical protein n=1 Tax=Mycobacteroides abscessus TaxID=36809 RepID=UPI001F15C397|nr:hypothetical protein [Mycobacteroides abscessus]